MKYRINFGTSFFEGRVIGSEIAKLEKAFMDGRVHKIPYTRVEDGKIANGIKYANLSLALTLEIYPDSEEAVR